MDKDEKSERDWFQTALENGFVDYIEEIQDQMFESLFWGLITSKTSRIEEIIKKGNKFAEDLQLKRREASRKEVDSPEFLPEWSLDLFEPSYVGRQAAFSGAMKGDEVSFMVLFLQSFFATEALRKVSQKQPEMVKKYAARLPVWPWYVTHVKNIENELRKQLDTFGFASQTRRRHKMASGSNKPESVEVMATLLWCRLDADRWDGKEPQDRMAKATPNYQEALRVLRMMPDRGGRTMEDIRSIIKPVVRQLLKVKFKNGLQLDHDKFSNRPQSLNERAIERRVDSLIDFMLRPDQAEDKRAVADLKARENVTTEERIDAAKFWDPFIGLGCGVNVIRILKSGIEAGKVKPRTESIKNSVDALQSLEDGVWQMRPKVKTAMEQWSLVRVGKQRNVRPVTLTAAEVQLLKSFKNKILSAQALSAKMVGRIKFWFSEIRCPNAVVVFTEQSYFGFITRSIDEVLAMASRGVLGGPGKGQIF